MNLNFNNLAQSEVLKPFVRFVVRWMIDLDSSFYAVSIHEYDGNSFGPEEDLKHEVLAKIVEVKHC